MTKRCRHLMSSESRSAKAKTIWVSLVPIGSHQKSTDFKVHLDRKSEFQSDKKRSFNIIIICKYMLYKYESTKLLQHSTCLDQVPNPIIPNYIKYIKVPNVDDWLVHYPIYPIQIQSNTYNSSNDIKFLTLFPRYVWGSMSTWPKKGRASRPELSGGPFQTAFKLGWLGLVGDMYIWLYIYIYIVYICIYIYIYIYIV